MVLTVIISTSHKYLKINAQPHPPPGQPIFKQPVMALGWTQYDNDPKGHNKLPGAASFSKFASGCLAVKAML
jgi:hypothetical protein